MLQRSAGLYKQCTCQCTVQQGGINTLPEGKFNNINPAGTESFDLKKESAFKETVSETVSKKA